MSDIAYISDRTGLIVSWIHDGRLCCHSFSREDRLFVAGQLFHLLYMSLQYCSLLKRGHHACLRENDFDEMPS